MSTEDGRRAAGLAIHAIKLTCGKVKSATSGAPAAILLLALGLLLAGIIFPAAMLFVAIICFSEIKRYIRSRKLFAVLNSLKFYAALIIIAKTTT